MNERRFPKGKEWDDIVENAFSSTDTHSFSAAYRQQREILQKGQTMNRKDDINTPESRRERTIIKSTGGRRNVKAIAAAISVIAAAAVIIAVPAGVMRNSTTVPGAEIGDVSGDAVQGDTVEEDIAADESGTEEEITDISATEPPTPVYETIVPELWTEITQLPEGVIYHEDGAYAGKYTRGSYINDEGYTIEEWYMTTGTLYTGNELTVEGIVSNVEANNPEWVISYDVDDFSYDGKTVIRFGGDVPWRRTYVLFDGTNYGYIFYFADQATEDEIAMLIDNVQLVENSGGKKIFVEVQSGDETESSGDEADIAEDSESSDTETADSSADFAYGTEGDSLEWSYHEGEKDFNISMTLDKITYQTNVDGITTDGLGRPVSSYDDFRTYANALIESDGTISDIDGTQSYAVIADFTVTNNSDSEAELCVFPTFFMENGSGGYTELIGDGRHISFSADRQAEKNEALIAPGETCSVQCVFAVTEAELSQGIYFTPAPHYYSVDTIISDGTPIFYIKK
ncbi:MAG: hypothetical protein IJ874_08345 [Ruminococcus sp.]|nr:hypothetical protein [Ruminococcus sp.]